MLDKNNRIFLARISKFSRPKLKNVLDKRENVVGDDLAITCLAQFFQFIERHVIQRRKSPPSLMTSIFDATTLIVTVNFLKSVENTSCVDCFVNNSF